jgi:hypothetical protein
VLIVDASMLDRVGDPRQLPRHVVLVAADEASETALGRRTQVSRSARMVERVGVAHFVQATCATLNHQ